MWTAILLRLLGHKMPLLSFSFHFSKLPTGARLLLARWAFSRVARFCVHSEPEKLRYAQHFGLPIDRFEMILWGVRPSSVEVAEAPAPSQVPYICAMGKDGRDYATLIEAMKSLPDMTLLVVAQPHNLAGLDVPANVKVSFDIPREEALNILKHSQFMALPLEDNETSCGHITLVSAMFCRKAIVATNSTGIADYFPADYDAPTVAARDVDGWVRALRTLYGDTKRLERCADAGERFSRLHCSHNAAFVRTIEFIRSADIDVSPDVSVN
jgi:glycosyltransferase involved in cell wall biosynthesis